LTKHQKQNRKERKHTMNKNSLLRAVRNGAKRIFLGVGGALTLMFLYCNASANEVLLGTANNFAVLAASAITSTGATVINGGNVGESPGSAISGFPPAAITPPFTTDLGNAVALQAQKDLTTAYNTAVGLPVTRTLTGTDLGGLTLTPGTYFFATSAQLTGTLTLNDLGNPDAIFVFQIGKTLTTAANSSVVTINDPSTPGISVFWQVGSSATLGAGTDFEGNILANIHHGG
jgi:Ice-binding-like